MANHAYVNVWCRGFPGERMPGLLEGFLRTVPLSAQVRGFTSLVIRAVGMAEAPVLERSFRLAPLDAATLASLARDSVNPDSAYEIQAYWDLWLYDAEPARWALRPQPLEIFCYGEEFDDGAFRECGHFQADIGFEHMFTGHAGLLGLGGQPVAAPQHPVEAAFLSAMRDRGNLCEYKDRTRANIRKLFDWITQIESALPVERFALWSEGETNFEARLDDILAVG